MDTAHEVGASERSEPPASAAHLLTADDVLAEGNQCGTYLAVCGALVPASSLPSSPCPPGCECDCALYCPQCVHHVVRYAVENADHGENKTNPHDELDDDEPDQEPEPLGRFVGECGHSRVVNYLGHIGPCSCDT
jgi:hypothetical protein